MRKLITVFLSVIVLSGCTNIREADCSEEAVVKINSSEVRTILPSVTPDDLKEIRVSATDAEGAVKETVYDSYPELISSSIQLSPGCYTFMITAISGGCLFTSVPVTKNIELGLNFLDVTLYQSSTFSISGKGAVDISAVFDEEPEEECFVRFEFLLLPLLEASGDFSSDVLEKEAHLSAELNAGSYVLKTTAYSYSGLKLKSHAEVVRVADGLCTTGIIKMSKINNTSF